MAFDKDALHNLEMAFIDHYPGRDGKDAEINRLELIHCLKQWGVPVIMDMDKVQLAYRYPGYNVDKLTCEQLGIVTDTSYLHISIDQELIRHVLVERWPLVMDQATYHLYASHSKNPNQLVQWPDSTPEFYLSYIGFDELRWTNDDSDMMVKLKREEATHLSDTFIHLTSKDDQ